MARNWNTERLAAWWRSNDDFRHAVADLWDSPLLAWPAVDGSAAVSSWASAKFGAAPIRVDPDATANDRSGSGAPTVPEMATTFIPSDDRFLDQWHHENTGQLGGLPGIDINVTEVWDDYDGTGIVVHVVDEGVQHTHADLNDNYDTSIDWDYAGNDSNPLPSGNGEGHGTAVAGLIAAENNGVGAVGVAFGATVAGHRALAGGLDVFGGELANVFHSLVDNPNTATVGDGADISNNSWGFVAPFADNFNSGSWPPGPRRRGCCTS